MQTREQKKALQKREDAETRTETRIVPFDSAKFIVSAKKYCEIMGLPPESASAVLVAAESYQKLKETIERQASLPPERRKALIQSKEIISDALLAQIDEMAKTYMIPYDCWAIIEHRPYIRAEGMRNRFRADPRIPKMITAKELPKLDIPDNPNSRWLVTVHFWNGEYYEEIGACDLRELQARRRSSEASPAFMDMIAKTRGERRAIRSALGLPVGVAEDIEEAKEYDEGAPVIESIRKEIATPTEPESRTQLIAFAKRDLGFDLKQMMEILGIKSISEITDIKSCWERLLEAYHPNEKQNTPANSTIITNGK